MHNVSMALNELFNIWFNFMLNGCGLTVDTNSLHAGGHLSGPYSII